MKEVDLQDNHDLLTPAEIKSGLQTKVLGQHLYCYATIDSTNEAAKRAALAGALEGTVIVAEEQKQGKGRLGRYWYSPSSQGLWFSLVLRPPLKPTEASQITFVSAVAVCKALRSLTGLPLKLKWPNDLLYENKKIGGILTESSAEMDGINYLVVGIGININQQKNDFPTEIKEKASSLFMASGRLWQRAGILVKILQEYEKEYEKLLIKGFEETLLDWREFNTTLGQEIVVTTKEESFNGIAENINENGSLLVRRESGEIEVLLAGDVTLRRQERY